MRPLGSERPWTPECERIATFVAGGFYWPGAGRDDVLQEARIGVAKALRDWEPASGAGFRSFATMCARRHVATALKLATTGKHSVLNEASSLDEPLGRYTAGDDVGTLHDLLWRDNDDPCQIVIARETIRELLSRFRRLTPLEREVVERCALLGESYDQVGPVKAVDNALQRAKRKLRDDRPDPDSGAGLRVIYVDRTIHPTERQATAAAVGVCPGRVVAVAKRKLIDGRERAPQGRPDSRGRRGQPVWRVDLMEAA